MNNRNQISGTRLSRSFYLLALSVLLITGSANVTRAQWTTPDASNNINSTNSGNVGIGTSTPTAKLQVTGSITATSLQAQATNTGIALIATGGLLDQKGWSIQANINRNSLYFATVNDGLTYENPYMEAFRGTGMAIARMHFYPNVTFGSNVGIGTASPGSQLFVGSGTPAVATLSGLNVALGGNSYISASNGAVNTFIGSDTSPYGIVGTLSNHPLGLRANNVLAMTILPSGNIGIGTASPTAKLQVAGDVNATGTITGGNIVAKYQDIAEWVPTSKVMPAGTVVVLDSTHTNYVTSSSKSYDTKVAGVISAQPGIALGESGANKVLVATTGRVKVKVDASRAPIQIGDLLVTSDRAGLAMKSEPLMISSREFHSPGTLIGKALEPLPSGTGEILVLLSLQ